MQTLKPGSYGFWSHDKDGETYSVNTAGSDPIKGCREMQAFSLL